MNPPDGFLPIQGLPFQIGEGRPIFSDSAANLRLFGNQANRRLWGIVKFKEEFVGPPGYAHGGAQAYILDEAMGTVCWNSNVPVVAKSIQINFKKTVPLHTDLFVTAQIEKREGNDLVVSSSLLGSDESIFAAGSGFFHVITYKQFSHILKSSSIDLSRWFPELR